MEIGISGVIAAYIFQVFSADLVVKAELESQVYIDWFEQYFDNCLVSVDVFHSYSMPDPKNSWALRPINRIGLMHEYSPNQKYHKRGLKKLN